MNSLTYITRRCSRNCDYCDIVNSPLKRELTTIEWIKAFYILKEIGVKFNLILGNEAWLLGRSLISIMKKNQVPYALYSTCPPSLFQRFHKDFFESGVIDNLSCGIDYPFAYSLRNEKKKKKSSDGWKGLITTKTLYSHVDCQGTVTVHKKNYKLLPTIVNQLTEMNIFCGINFIHYNSDGNFDFFPSADKLKRFFFMRMDLPLLNLILDRIKESKNTIQNIEMLKEDTYNLTHMGWHCKGDPYGGPTIDADGSLRCCGYRPGKRTPKYSIFDLPSKLHQWESAVFNDATECPGCFWSYPWMYNYWKKDIKFRDDVFIKHAGKHIDESKWAKRKLQCVE